MKEHVYSILRADGSELCVYHVYNAAGELMEQTEILPSFSPYGRIVKRRPLRLEG